MTNPNTTNIPERAFVDDLGRRWEWCGGGTSDTWAWRVTDAPVAANLAAVIAKETAALLAVVIGGLGLPYDDVALAADQFHKTHAASERTASERTAE